MDRSVVPTVLMHTATVLIVALCVATPWWMAGDPEALRNLSTALGVGVLAIVGALAYAFSARTAPVVWMVGSVAALALLALVLALQGGLSPSEATGLAFEPGTVMSWLVVGLAIISGYVLSSIEFVRPALLRGFMLGGFAIAALYVLGVIAPERFPVSFSLHVLSGMALLAGVFLFLRSFSPLERVAALCSVCVSFAIALTGHSSVLVFSLSGAVAVLAWWCGIAGGVGSMRRRVVFGIAVLLALAAFFTIPAHVAKSPRIPFQNEIRPSLAVTLSVWRAASAEDSLSIFLGTGSSFVESWANHRPARVNASPFWNADFPVGSGFVPTTLLTLGIVYALMLVGAFVWLGVRAYIIRDSARSARIGLTVITLWMFMWLVLYVPSLAVVALAALMVGFAFGLPAQTLAPPTRTPAQWLALAAVVVAALSCGALALLRFPAIDAYGRAVAAYTSQSPDAIDALLAESFEHVPLPQVARERSELQQMQIRVILAQPRELTEPERLSVSALANSAVVFAQQAVTLERTDYRNWMTLGSAETFHALSQGNQELFAQAITRYEEAARRAPEHPAPRFLLAQTYFLSGNRAEAEASLAQALALKPDYADALQLQQQMHMGQ